MFVPRRATAVLALALVAAVGLSAAAALAGCRKAPASLYVRMKVALYRGNAPEELEFLGEVGAGQAVKVVSTDGAWSQVEADGTTGWLPNWYLTASQGDALAETEPYFMITKSPADLRLTPQASDQALRRLDPGRIVEVRAVSGDWAYVGIRVYSIPDVQRGWVPVSVLGPRSEVKATEADLLAGTRVFFNDFSAPPDALAQGELTTYDQQVTVNGEVGPWAMVSAAGGWVAWVKSVDLSYPATGSGK